MTVGRREYIIVFLGGPYKQLKVGKSLPAVEISSLFFPSRVIGHQLFSWESFLLHGLAAKFGGPQQVVYGNCYIPDAVCLLPVQNRQCFSL